MKVAATAIVAAVASVACAGPPCLEPSTTIIEHLRFLPAVNIANWTYIEHADTELFLLGAQLELPPGNVHLALFHDALQGPAASSLHNAGRR